MAATSLRLLCLFAVATAVIGDCYLHNPRGSNNRLNERSANRNNANRMFDSQNNNRGGYNAGDTDDQNGFQTEDQIYYMKYFQSGTGDNSPSYLTIEWTNQHGCGGNEDNDPHKLNCNIVLQYMVQDYGGQTVPTNQDEQSVAIRNGVRTATQGYQAPPNNENTRTAYENRRNNQVQSDRGLHESFAYYDDCYLRERNQGLFTADQRLRRNNRGISSAIYTRQNPNGNRRGYECPEERDYYPYWHPTPWRDIAVLTDNVTLCNQLYRQESFNVQPRQICRENYTNSAEPRSGSQYNNEAECIDNGGVWYTEYAYIDIDPAASNVAQCNARNNIDGLARVWAKPTYENNTYFCLVLPGAPECRQVDWSRVNHLGNGRDGVPLNYTWRLPYFPSGRDKVAVLRIRYNISTDDYQPWTTNASSNARSGRRSPVEQNPNVDIGSITNKPLRLAINTAQFGRTFQDRSHAMVLRSRPSQLSQGCNQLYNLNVRGKRGNIVQVYPSVEYDFIPNRMTLNTSDCLHIQWTGSNTHNNGNPGGDGQTGDAGEGRGGTDRNNMVQISAPDKNYPIPWESDDNTLFKNAEVVWASWNSNPRAVTPEDLAVVMASSGYYKCYEGCPESVAAKNEVLQQLLNNASPSFEGAILRFPRTGTYHYICTRNNNFTNRSQKGQLNIVQSS